VATILILAELAGAFVLNWYFNQSWYGPGPVDNEVATSKPIYLQGEEVYFVVYVTNPQVWPVPQPDSASYRIEKDGQVFDGGTVFTDFVSPIPTFPPHSTTTYNPPLFWDQKTGPGTNRTQVQPDNYTLTMTLSGYGYSAGGNFTFEIRPPP
jgi:hypothetical protein